jgi:hypothetical protein
MEMDKQDSDWSRPRPEKLARPTWWPAALAFGSTLLVWGLIASWVILLCGAVVTIISLTGWIQDIRHEH